MWTFRSESPVVMIDDDWENTAGLLRVFATEDKQTLSPKQGFHK